MNDKRKLRDDYKQSFLPIGVYAIRNTVNQRVFIGGSRNLHGAMNRHRFELTTGAHRNAALQADWKLFGASAFCFEVLDQIKERQDQSVDYDAELASLLALWADDFADRGEQGYNLPASSGPPGKANASQRPTGAALDMKEQL